MSTFNLTIVTPFGIYFKGDVSFLEVSNEDSVLGILPKHTPIISTVKLGKILVIINGNRNIYATSGGILNVKRDGTVTLLLNTIERKDEIDLTRAKNAKQKALDRIKRGENLDNSATRKLERAQNRINIVENKND